MFRGRSGCKRAPKRHLEVYPLKKVFQTPLEDVSWDAAQGKDGWQLSLQLLPRLLHMKVSSSRILLCSRSWREEKKKAPIFIM